MEKTLTKPTAQSVKAFLDKWQHSNEVKKYDAHDEALHQLFSQLPNNQKLSDVLLKVSTLNDFYSTNIFQTYSVAKNIVALENVDERLKNGDISVVDDIRHNIIKDKKFDFYSFATKYCSQHNNKDFPIYDNFVDKILFELNKVEKFYSFKRTDLKDYKKFKEVVLAFQKYFGLEEFSIRQIDTYLWQYGKKMFSTSKEKK
ncbi:hypothetical protein [Haemophilus paracuniculus]|nr:hypothetical protein [Haemophilus paracuniculus]